MNTLLSRKRLQVIIATASVLSLSISSGCSTQLDKKLITETHFEPSKFQTLYPGIYAKKESALKEYFSEGEALENRGPVDIEALVAGQLKKDIPGVGKIIPVSPEWVTYQNKKYDPENPLYNDPYYAKSHGHPDVIVYPTFGIHDDSHMLNVPLETRDTLLAGDLNHNITFYRNVYPGDTLYIINDKRDTYDVTPDTGSVYRYTHTTYEGRVFNQKAEKVADVIFRVTRGTKIFKDSERPKDLTFSTLWEAPAWQARPAHYYTDSDWDYIIKIWQNEKRQGDTPLYWEDIKIGDQPTVTADGPILAGPLPVAPHGMGVGGGISLKPFIMNPATFAQMVRSKVDGIYRMPKKSDYVPTAPGQKPVETTVSDDPNADGFDVTDIHKETEKRAVLLNYVGRDFAIRHINNWIGDNGFIKNLRWSILDPRALAMLDKVVPKNPNAEHFLGRVPFMQDKFVNAHGLTKDMAIVKSYVYDKYVQDGSKHMVELVWWVETIEGDIWQEGGATIELPSRS